MDSMVQPMVNPSCVLGLDFKQDHGAKPNAAGIPRRKLDTTVHHYHHLIISDCKHKQTHAHTLYIHTYITLHCITLHYIHTYIYIQTYRHTDIQTYHTYIHTDIQTYIHTYRHTIHTYIHTHTDILTLHYITLHTYRQTYIHTHTYIHTGRQTYIHTDIHTYIQTDRHTNTHTYLHTYIQTDRQTNKQTYIHTHVHTYSIHTYINYITLHYITYIHTHTYICIYMVTDRIMETKRNVQLRQAAPASDFSIIGFFPIRVQNIPEVIRTFFFP